jgi:ribosomal protein S21
MTATQDSALFRKLIFQRKLPKMYEIVFEIYPFTLVTMRSSTYDEALRIWKKNCDEIATLKEEHAKVFREHCRNSCPRTTDDTLYNLARRARATVKIVSIF